MLSKQNLFCVSIVAIATFAAIAFVFACGYVGSIGSTEAVMILSLASVGLVIGGKEIDTITSLDDLQQVRNGVAKRIGELRDKFHERGDKEKGQPGKFEGEERAQFTEAGDHLTAIDARRDELRNSANIEEIWERSQQQDQENDRENRGRGRDGNINDADRGQRAEITAEVRSLAFQGWCLSQMDGELSTRQRKALKAVGRAARRSRQNIRLHDDTLYNSMQRAARSVHRTQVGESVRSRLPAMIQEQRALSTLTATAGSELVPEGFVNQVEINQLAYSGVLQAADIMRTSGGNEIPWPTMDDTSNEGEIIGQSQNVGASVDPTTGVITFKAYKFSSKPILIPYELLEDEGVAPRLPIIIANMIAERIGRAKERFYTNGTGINQPQGIVTGSQLGITSAAVGAITADEILRLEHSVDPAYRNNACYMMHDSITLLVRLLKDNDGQYLWRAGLRDGRPDMLNGRMLYTNQQMDSTPAAGNKIMLFGDMMNHKVREVNMMRFYRLTERYRDNDQDGFIAFCRGDSRTMNSGTPRITHLAVPAA